MLTITLLLDMALHIIMMDICIIIFMKDYITTLYIIITIGISVHIEDHLDMAISQIIGIGDQDHIWEDFIHLEGQIILEDLIETMAMIEDQSELIIKIECQMFREGFKIEVLAQCHHQGVIWIFKGKAGQADLLEMAAVQEILVQESLEGIDNLE